MQNGWEQLLARAEQCMEQQRHAEAAALLRQMTALRPDDADSWFNLGYCLRQARAYAHALDAYAEALRHAVEGPEAAHVNRAAILSEYLEQTDAAEAELRQAIQKNPQFLPAWLNLGGLMEDIGNANAAADAYRSALRLAPGNGRARARLAAIRVHTGDTEGAIRDLTDRLQIGADTPDDAAELLFALGNALDTARLYSKAFAAITEANRINARMRPPARRYNRQAQTKLVDDLIARYPAPPATASIAGYETSMIFICGMFRSGSTVIEQLIGRHPQVQVGGELELIPALIREHLMPYPETLDSLNVNAVDRLRADYMATIAANFPNAIYVTDKRPDNFLHIGLIKTLFPTARIVHTRRAALDNILSVYFMNFSEAINYSDRLEDIVHYFGQYRRLMTHWQNIFGPDIITIDYDKMVRGPEATIAQTFSDLELPALDPANGGSDAPPPIIRTPSNWKARSTVNDQSSGRWQNYAEELRFIRRQLDEIYEQPYF